MQKIKHVIKNSSGVMTPHMLQITRKRLKLERLVEAPAGQASPTHASVCLVLFLSLHDPRIVTFVVVMIIFSPEPESIVPLSVPCSYLISYPH